MGMVKRLMSGVAVAAGAVVAVGAPASALELPNVPVAGDTVRDLAGESTLPAGTADLPVVGGLSPVDGLPVNGLPVV